MSSNLTASASFGVSPRSTMASARRSAKLGVPKETLENHRLADCNRDMVRFSPPLSLGDQKPYAYEAGDDTQEFVFSKSITWIGKVEDNPQRIYWGNSLAFFGGSRA